MRWIPGKVGRFVAWDSNETGYLGDMTRFSHTKAGQMDVGRTQENCVPSSPIGPPYSWEGGYS
jgi:hypothetical protein